MVHSLECIYFIVYLFLIFFQLYQACKVIRFDEVRKKEKVVADDDKAGAGDEKVKAEGFFQTGPLVNASADFLSDLKVVTNLATEDFTTGLFFLNHTGFRFPFESFSGGQVDAFMTLYGLHYAILQKKKQDDQGPVLLMLDEPGQNLGAHERKLLQERIRTRCQENKIQLLLVTHHVEMLDRDRLPAGVLRGALISETSGHHAEWMRTRFGFRSVMKSTIEDSVCNAELLSLWFSRGVILVEGQSDRRFLNALSQWLRRAAVPDIEDKTCTYDGIVWDILQCNGGGHIFKVKNVLKIFKIPCLVILDSDKNPFCSGGAGGSILSVLWNPVASKKKDIGNKSISGLLDHTHKEWVDAFEKVSVKEVDEEEDREPVNMKVYWPLSVCDIEGVLLNKNLKFGSDNVSDPVSAQDIKSSSEKLKEAMEQWRITGGDTKWNDLESAIQEHLKPILGLNYDAKDIGTIFNGLNQFEEDKVCQTCEKSDKLRATLKMTLVCSSGKHSEELSPRSISGGAFAKGKTFFYDECNSERAIIARIDHCYKHAYPVKLLIESLAKVPGLLHKKSK